MNKHSLLYAILIVLVFLGGLSVSTMNAKAGPSIATNTDWVTHGTAWVPQTTASFSIWRPFGWGVMAKSAAAADRWVHMPLTYGASLNGTAQNIVYVEFCAKSSRGAITKPIEMDLWDMDTRFLAETVSWPADNSLHCWHHTFAPVWHQEIGMSVLLRYANTTDTITLYKAWVSTKP